MKEMGLNNEQEAAHRARKNATEAILNHPSKKKVVVGGPGTGKTHLFSELLGGKSGKKLTLTFINPLVNDLSLKLKGLSEVRTLHGYALSKLSGKTKIYPKLPDIIHEDALFILDKDIDFEERINRVDNSDGYLDFYSSRREFYDYFTFSDIVLGLVSLFKEKPEKIPTYSQIVVDEFQDFNELEVRLIELLGSKSPILIVGDDDQALYGFKKADRKYIRELHSESRPEFKYFPLEFCSRSTRVIVDSVNDIISKSIDLGFLNGRIPKKFSYFSSPTKDKESADEPKIIRRRVENTQIAWYIASQIDEIALQKRDKFEVLIISPFPVQCRTIYKALTRDGFTAIKYVKKEKVEISYLDGLKMLIQNSRGGAGNLGWRIAAKFKLNEEDLADVVRVSTTNRESTFRSLLGEEVVKAIEKDISLLKRVKDGKKLSDKELDELFKALSLDQHKVKTDYLGDKLYSNNFKPKKFTGIKDIPITLTTIQSSKGLSAEYVFITHLDQRYLPGDGGVSDESIYSFLVALTRARKKVWLISTTDKVSEIINWIKGDRIK